MPWYKKLKFLIVQRNCLLAAAIFLSASVLTGQSVSAEVLSFSIIHESFQLNGTSVDKDNQRTEQLRKSFLLAPLEGRELTISSGFGLRVHPVLNKQKVHNGVDYAAPKGTPIRTTADGTIEFIGRQRGYGKVIVVRHIANFTTIYAHQSRFARGVKKGDFVSMGDTIGYVGSTGTATGNNLHYELRIDDEPVDPLQVDGLYVENEYVGEDVN